MRHPAGHNSIPRTPELLIGTCEDFLKKRSEHVIFPRGLALLAASFFLSIAPAFAQTTRETLQYLGTSQLDAIAATSIPYDDLHVSPHPDSDAELAGINRGPGSASVPVITAPLGISAPTQSVKLIFNGLTHRDQRFAGTGIYVNTQFSTEPPDEGLAVGDGYVLQAVNAALAIYDANTGALRQGPTALNQFFRLKPEINRSTGSYGDFTSDPRTYYDAQLQRWLVSVTAVSTDSASGSFIAPTHLLLAISESSDPTQGWKLYSIDTTNDGFEGCPCFGDQPLVGADAHGIFISTNAFSLKEGFAGVQLYAFSKRLLASGAIPTVEHWNSPQLQSGLAFSLQPATQSSFATDDDSHGVEYFTGVADIRNMLDHRIAVWAISNTASLADATPSLKLRATIVGSEPFGVPPDAAQKTGETELGSLVGEKQQFIATNDQRMQQTVFADGKLWSTLTTIVAVGNDPTPRAGIAYFVVTPSLNSDGGLKAEIFRQGYVAVPNTDVFYPALAVGEDGTGAIAFTISGPEHYLSAAFVPFSTAGIGDVQIVAAGTAPHDGFSGYKYFGGGGSGRTGDYSAAAVDEHGSIWIATEYIPSSPRTLLSNWGTFIAEIAGH